MSSPAAFGSSRGGAGGEFDPTESNVAVHAGSGGGGGASRGVSLRGGEPRRRRRRRLRERHARDAAGKRVRSRFRRIDSMRLRCVFLLLPFLLLLLLLRSVRALSRRAPALAALAEPSQAPDERSRIERFPRTILAEEPFVVVLGSVLERVRRVLVRARLLPCDFPGIASPRVLVPRGRVASPRRHAPQRPRALAPAAEADRTKLAYASAPRSRARTPAHARVARAARAAPAAALADPARIAAATSSSRVVRTSKKARSESSNDADDDGSPTEAPGGRRRVLVAADGGSGSSPSNASAPPSRTSPAHRIAPHALLFPFPGEDPSTRPLASAATTVAIAARRSLANTSNHCECLATSSNARERRVGAFASIPSQSSQSPPASIADSGRSFASPARGLACLAYAPNAARMNVRNARPTASSSNRPAARICRASADRSSRVGRVGIASRSSGKCTNVPESRSRWNTSSVGSASNAFAWRFGSPTRNGTGAVRTSRRVCGRSGTNTCCHLAGAASRRRREPPRTETRGPSR